MMLSAYKISCFFCCCYTSGAFASKPIANECIFYLLLLKSCGNDANDESNPPERSAQGTSAINLLRTALVKVAFIAAKSNS
jgi:hypothetical protein